MADTIVVRKLDDLCRLVIPKDVRKAVNFCPNDPIEIVVKGKELILRKYIPDDLIQIAEKFLKLFKKQGFENVCFYDTTGTIMCGRGDAKIDLIACEEEAYCVNGSNGQPLMWIVFDIVEAQDEPKIANIIDYIEFELND